jgi:hypothetical protein
VALDVLDLGGCKPLIFKRLAWPGLAFPSGDELFDDNIEACHIPKFGNGFVVVVLSFPIPRPNKQHLPNLNRAVSSKAGMVFHPKSSVLNHSMEFGDAFGTPQRPSHHPDLISQRHIMAFAAMSKRLRR